MIDGISFVNKELWLPLVLGGLLAFAFYVWKEWKTRSTGKFALNTLVAFLTIIALIFLILQPTKEVEISERQGLLVTSGFDVQQKDSLMAIVEGIKEVTYNPTTSIRNELDSLTGLIILGNGVEPFDFELFRTIPTAYIPTKEPIGITDLKTSESLLLGEKLSVAGAYTSPVTGNYLVLEDAGGNGLDSVKLGEQKTVRFSLEAVPKVSGRFVFQLTEKDSIGTELHTEPIPVIIHKKNLLRVLILNNFPTFETKYIKNFLADNGHEVIVRSQLTKGKFKFEYFNTSSAPVYQFTDEVLAKFDLVIIDTDTYFNLGTTGIRSFEKSSRETGLGVFLQPSDLLFKLGNEKSYFQFKRDGIDELNVPTFKSTLQKYPFTFDEQLTVKPIILGTETTVAVYKQLGSGRFATTTLQNSYQLLLQGKTAAYNRLWTQIFDKISKKEEVPVAWEAITRIPRIDIPFEFTMRTRLTDFNVIHEDDQSIGMLQNTYVPTLYSGKVYPSKSGWNKLNIETDSSAQYSFYVFDKTTRKSLEISKTIAANKKEFESGIPVNRTVRSERPISPMICYLFFLAGIGWLWLYPKLSEN